MGFRDVITNYNSEVYRALEELWCSGAITFRKKDDGKTWYFFDYRKLPPYLIGMAREFDRLGVASVLEATVTTSGMREGPKIIALSHLDAEALENTRVNIGIDDYAQPFPTIFVDLPKTFSDKYNLACLQAGEVVGKSIRPERHYPHTVGIRFHKTDDLCFMVVAVYFTSDQVYSALLDHVVAPVIDDAIEIAFTPAYMVKSSIEGTTEEHEATKAALRVALNTVLILEGEGMRRVGPRDPRHYKKLEDNLAKARKRRDPIDKQKKAEQLLKSEPIYYTFDQNVVLYHREDAPHEGTSEPTGRHLRPHWRSGYHRMQRYGAGNLQKKRIRIPPVMVNRSRFLGRDGDTSATYTD